MNYRVAIRGVRLERPIDRYAPTLEAARSAAKAELRKLPQGAFAEVFQATESAIERIDKEE